MYLECSESSMDRAYRAKCKRKNLGISCIDSIHCDLANYA